MDNTDPLDDQAYELRELRYAIAEYKTAIDRLNRDNQDLRDRLDRLDGYRVKELEELSMLRSQNKKQVELISELCEALTISLKNQKCEDCLL